MSILFPTLLSNITSCFFTLWFFSLSSYYPRHKWNDFYNLFTCCFLNFICSVFQSRNPDPWQHICVYTPLIKVSCHYLDNKCLEWKENRHTEKNVSCSYMLQEYVCHTKGFEASYREQVPRTGCHDSQEPSRQLQLCPAHTRSPFQVEDEEGSLWTRDRKCVSKGTWWDS